MAGSKTRYKSDKNVLHLQVPTGATMTCIINMHQRMIGMMITEISTSHGVRSEPQGNAIDVQLDELLLMIHI